MSSLPSIGAGNRLRLEQYAPRLRAHGIALETSAFFDDATAGLLYDRERLGAKIVGTVRGVVRRLRDAWRVREYDLVTVYRESLPLGPPLFERYLASAGVPYLYDFDDAIYLGPMHPTNRRWAWLRHPSRVDYAARHAAAICVSNEYLARWARERNPNVLVLPTPVDTDVFRPRQRESRKGPVMIGWTGSSTTAPYLRMLDRVFMEIAKRHNVTLRIIGGEYTHASAHVECRRFRIETEPDEVAQFDIGVLPQPDDPWTRGKAGFKALLYMAAGLPVVASAGEVNEAIILEGESGYIVADEGEWIDRLDRLVVDEELRRRLGSAGRVRAERLYSLRVATPKFAAVLRSASSG